MKAVRRASFVALRWALVHTPVGRAVLVTEWTIGFEYGIRLGRVAQDIASHHERGQAADDPVRRLARP